MKKLLNEIMEVSELFEEITLAFDDATVEVNHINGDEYVVIVDGENRYICTIDQVENMAELTDIWEVKGR